MTIMTTLEQDCTSLQSATGSPLYQIVTEVTYVNPGDLPSANVFVFLINDALDPKQDLFQRVASVADLGLYQSGRDNAINAASAYYLAPAFTVRYSDVASATAAKGVIRDRVNQLINDWMLAQSAFFTPVEFQLPSVDSTVVVAAKATYEAAKADLAIANAAVTSAQAAVVSAQAGAATANQGLTAATARKMECSGQTGGANAVFLAQQDFLSRCNALLNALTGGPPTYSLPSANRDAFATAIATQTMAGLLTGLSGSLGDSCATRGRDLVTAAQAKTSADAAVAAAQTNVQSVQAAATAASIARDKALATVLAYCPTFDPSA